MLKYPAHRYDLTMRLKLSPLLLLVMLYAIRHLIFLLVKKDAGGSPWVHMQLSLFLLCTDIPAALVLYAIGHRVKNANTIMMKVWRNGRLLLLASYLAAMAIFAYLNGAALSDPKNYEFMTASSVLVVDGLAVAYLLFSGLVRDIFADFIG